MGSTESKICVICQQLKPIQDFPKVTADKFLLGKNAICTTCYRIMSQEDDEGGSGGGLQLKKDAKQLQYAIDLEAALKKARENLNNLAHNKDMFGVSQTLEDERKKQTAQRETLHQKEEARRNETKNDEPNPELTENTKLKREKITRLFSVTRLLARNHLTSNQTKAAAQKNFGIFSHIKKQQLLQKIEQINKVKSNKALSTESSSLFSQQHTAKNSVTDEAEKLITAIREGQKIFKR